MPRCVDSDPSPATGDRAITQDQLGKPITVGLIPAHYDNCRIQLDSPEEEALLSYRARTIPPQTSLNFNHCIVIYKGGTVQLQTHLPLVFQKLPMAILGI
jgi:hypothetical protein